MTGGVWHWHGARGFLHTVEGELERHSSTKPPGAGHFLITSHITGPYLQIPVERVAGSASGGHHQQPDLVWRSLYWAPPVRSTCKRITRAFLARREVSPAPSTLQLPELSAGRITS